MVKPVLMLLLSLALNAEEWALVIRADSPLDSLSAAQIRDVYLGKIRYVRDVRLFPLQLGAEDPLRQQFEGETLKLSRAALREWWIRRHYLGQRPPKVVGSAEAVLAYVQQVEGAVGYIPYAMAVDANVTVLHYEAGTSQ
ncbi:hypothetical protein LOH54_11935 [Sulfurimonas sp. HSL-3221]|uniref:hypothetical protein n=1 Tax=Thiomicrolovo sulfuroxydans TaxID=2894755 RepID=UPI001E2D115C|nr:hypothetical protein [Sulfurimonas sp. HSL-3221]UFS62349.1 hypothetical protein LOH54_11935 [Sulfurimonas sp. HSL-3221]